MAFHKNNQRKLKQVQEIFSEYNMPITLRQLYYQMVARQYIPNNQKTYHSLSRLCVIARDEGSLQEESFADRLRIIDQPSSWDDLKSFLTTVKSSYRKNNWDTQDNYLEIWSEKDALRGVISPITHKYDVPLLIVRGQLSRTAVYEAHKRFLSASEQGKFSHLFYFGDFDPSGIGIYNSLKNRTKKFGNGILVEDIKFERIALSEQQIEDYNLPYIKAKKDDPNYKKFIAKYSDKAVELDALPPNVLMELIEKVIIKHIDQKKWAAAKVQENKEQDELQNIMNEF
jgi:hypothetical protein